MLNLFIPNLQCKMKDLHLLKDLLKEKKYLSKVDLKDICFCATSHQNHQRFVWFQWERVPIITLPMFWVVFITWIFKKLLEIPAAILHAININSLLRQGIVSESDYKSSGRWLKIHWSLSQQPSFVINLKKSVLTAMPEKLDLGLSKWP